MENPAAMVQIQASCIEYLLHGCWEVLHTVGSHCRDIDNANANADNESGNGTRTAFGGVDTIEHVHVHERYMEMYYSLEVGGLSFQGNCVNFNGAFLAGTSNDTRSGTFAFPGHNDAHAGDNEEMSFYCIRTRKEDGIDKSSVSILVDNERFVCVPRT